MAFRYREKYLVEKCINTITNDYLNNKEYHSALQDYRIDFISFLVQNEPQYVEYGIGYLHETYPEQYELVRELIMEYYTNGTKDGLSWDPIPGKMVDNNPVYENVELQEKQDTTTYNIDENDCTVKEKIVLFVMKLLKM